MSNQPSMWASFMLTATTREKMTWVNSRASDLQRHLGGVKSAVDRLLDGHADIEEVDHEVAQMIARLEFVRDHCRSLAELRAKDSP